MGHGHRSGKHLSEQEDGEVKSEGCILLQALCLHASTDRDNFKCGIAGVL